MEEEVLEITKEAYLKAPKDLKKEIDIHMKFKSYERIKALTHKIETQPQECDKVNRKVFATKNSVKLIYGFVVSLFFLILSQSPLVAKLVGK